MTTISPIATRPIPEPKNPGIVPPWLQHPDPPKILPVPAPQQIIADPDQPRILA